MTRKRPKTYEADFGGKKASVTVPPNDPAEPDNELRDLVQDCISPQAAALLGARPTGDDAVDRGVRWFAGQLAELLGGWGRVSDILAELGHITIDRR